MKRSGSIEWLKSEFERRKRKNSGYSLRAFAQFLETSPAQISQILSLKRPLTWKAASQFSDRLGLSPVERKRFLAGVRAEENSTPDFYDLNEEAFLVISEWQHFAFLSLMQLADAKPDLRWASRRLGVLGSALGPSIDRLIRLGIIDPVTWKQITNPIRVAPGKSSSAIRRHHAQYLELALNRLENVDHTRRESHTITFPADPRLLGRVQNTVDEFLTEVSDTLEQGQTSSVYCLTVQLFPVTQDSSSFTQEPAI